MATHLEMFMSDYGKRGQGGQMSKPKSKAKQPKQDCRRCSGTGSGTGMGPSDIVMIGPVMVPISTRCKFCTGTGKR